MGSGALHHPRTAPGKRTSPMRTGTRGGHGATLISTTFANGLGTSTEETHGRSKFSFSSQILRIPDSLHHSYLDETLFNDWTVNGHVNHYAFPAASWGPKTNAFLREFADAANTSFENALATGRRTRTETESVNTISQVLNGFRLD